MVGTTTPDMFFPSTACLVQNRIGAAGAWGFDLGAACSGFTYAVTTAVQMVASGAHEHALAIGADVMSRIIDYQDRATCVLFGDGAGAVVVSPAVDPELRIIDFVHEVDGSGAPALRMPAGGSRMPASRETVDQRLHYVHQDGAAVYKFAVRKTRDISRRVLERNGFGPGDVDLFVSHQANRRIITAAAEQLGLPDEKVMINIDRYRQHHRRHHSPRPRGRARGAPPQEGGPRAARVGGRRFHGRRGTAALGLLVRRHDWTFGVLRGMGAVIRQPWLAVNPCRVHRFGRDEPAGGAQKSRAGEPPTRPQGP